jgi:acetylornithine deacetylase/succinyl-diaminopimelate desuccinylase-like protein
MWRFATDAGYFVQKGAIVLGFGPGYEQVIHTVEEHISIPMMVEAVVGCAALALALT